MSDLRDFTGKNRKFTGVSGIKVSSDGLSDSDRVDEKGRLRFNDTTDLLEYYNGSAWKSIDAPPVITSFAIDGGSNVTSGVIDNEGGGTVTLAINGSLFDTTGATVTAVGGGETLSTSSLTRNNANLLTAVFTESQFDISNSPYTIKVTNGSGLSAELADAISADQSTITFNQSANTTVTLGDASRGAGISAAALCGATGATSFAVTTGSLPGGLSMTSGTGAITGTANAVGSNTTSTFTVTATGDDATSTRQFKITINSPQVQTFNSPGTFTAVPSGAVNVLVVAGGAGAGSQHCGGGGAGGLIYRPAFPISGNQSVTVGAGSPGGPKNYNPGNGSDSVFGTLTAKGGGGAGHGWPGGPNIGKPGGSGGGASSPGNVSGGSATQPGQPGDSGTYGFGHAGGNSNTGNSGGGGGGAGAAGTPNGSGRAGGAGKTYSISGSAVTYAGGGGGASHSDGPGGAGGSGGGGAGGTHPGPAGGSATGHRGSGGGGGADDGRVGGNGGSGVVIVSY